MDNFFCKKNNIELYLMDKKGNQKEINLDILNAFMNKNEIYIFVKKNVF